MADVEARVELNTLLDFYGPLLTEHRREVLRLYCEEDLSLAEIAEQLGITRQGVRDTVKRAEDSDDLIVRLYECKNKRAHTTLRFGFDVRRACLCDLTENELEPLTVDGRALSLTVKPFEIVTLKLSR